MRERHNEALIPKRSFLESAPLPYRELVRLAAREGNRPKPIYQVHKWFARRLGCSFRSLLVSATNSPGSNFWDAYYKTTNLKGLTILDPFVGGGTSVVEASRLGASVIGVDVDPIACAISTMETSLALPADFEAKLTELQEKVGKKLSKYHEVTVRGRRITILHHFWVQLVQCSGCSKELQAHHNFVLSRDAKETWCFCSYCNETHKLGPKAKYLDCSACSRRTNLEKGIVEHGVLSCPQCGTEERLIEVGRKTRRPPRWFLFAYEGFEQGKGNRRPMSERAFYRATKRERDKYEDAKLALRAVTKYLPKRQIARKRSDSRLLSYGYRDWADLFNSRQLLHLGLLFKELQRLPREYRHPFSIAFSNHLTTNCMLTSYAAGWRRLVPLFSLRAFRHVPRPVEINPWTDGIGRGSFPNAVRQLMRAQDYLDAPKEPTQDGGFVSVPSIKPHQAPKVVCGSARNMHFLASSSVDMVLTDPPYFDNVAYSELAEFFSPWMEKFKLIPNLAERKRSVSQSISAVGRREDSAALFAETLGEAFAEVGRVLKRDGILAFTFRHSTPEAWEAVAHALQRSGLKPVQVLPLPGESGSGLHIHDGTSTWDAVLVLRKRQKWRFSQPNLTREAQRKAIRHSLGWKKKLARQSSLKFSSADLVNLQRATLAAASVGLFPKDQSKQVDLGHSLIAANQGV